jgi:hypothetical protein
MWLSMRVVSVTRSARLTVGALAALYLLWLVTWLVLGDASYGPSTYHWDQVTAAAATGIIAFTAARRRRIPYRGFLVMQGVAFLLLAGSWVTYQASSGSSVDVAISQQGAGNGISEISDWIYGSCVFVLMCAWGYLALERWGGRPLSSLTTLVFAALMAGLGAIFASFYHQQYGPLLTTTSGRLDAVTAALEFAVLAAGLLCILLKEPPAVVWMLVGTVILMAGDMAYSVAAVPEGTDAVWMLGQFLVLSAVAAMPRTSMAVDAPAAEGPEATGRSSLSGILILVSLGTVLLSPLVWFLPIDLVWKSFVSVLFIVALVILMVWITDRFDETVSHCAYVRRVHESHLGVQGLARCRSTNRDGFAIDRLDAFLTSSGFGCATRRTLPRPERLYEPP